MSNKQAGEHTQEEWFYNSSNNFIFSLKRKKAIAKIIADFERTEQTEKNAILIASAPLLLSALKEITEFLAENYPSINIEKELRAIDAAEGK